MTVAQLDIIDFVATKPDTNEIFLIITDHLSWDEDGHIDTLKSKVNAYIDYIKSNALLETYPDANEKSIVIELRYEAEPNMRAFEVFADFTKIGKDLNFRFSHRFEHIQ
jgi:hypothetical protein